MLAACLLHQGPEGCARGLELFTFPCLYLNTARALAWVQVLVDVGLGVGLCVHGGYHATVFPAAAAPTSPLRSKL